ncbi:hypothetical protein CL635_01475 [bacterium]|nr:hypothetical protein [bacterium]
MQQKETPKSQQEQPAEKQEFSFVQQPQKFAEAFGIEEKHHAEWAENLKSLQDLPIPDPDLVGPRALNVLNDRYMLLERRRKFLAATLLGSERLLIDKNLHVPEDKKITLIRYFSRYYKDRQIYLQLREGKKIPVGIEVPEYMNKYVLNEKNEEVTLKAMEFMLPLQYDVTDRVFGFDSNGKPKVTPDQLKETTETIAFYVVSRGMRMSSVLKLLDEKNNLKDNDALLRQFLVEAGKPQPTTDEVKSAKFFLAYLAKNMEKVERYALFAISGEAIDSKDKEYKRKVRERVGQLTVADALGASTQMQAVSQTLDGLITRARSAFEDQKMPDMTELISQVMEQSGNYPERAVQIAMAPLAKLQTEEDRNNFRRNALKVADFYTSGQGSDDVPVKDLSVVDKKTKQETGYVTRLDNVPQQKLTLALAEEVCSQETIDMMLTSLTVPTQSDDSFHKNIRAELTKIVGLSTKNSKLHLKDAFELYYFRENVGPNPLLAYRSIALMRKFGDKDLAENVRQWYFRQLANKARKAVTAADTSELFKEYNLSPEQERELSNTLRYLEARGFGSVEELWRGLWANLINWWDVYLAIGAVAWGAAKGIKYSLKWMIQGRPRLNLAKLRSFAEMKTGEVRALIEKDVRQKLGENATDLQVKAEVERQFVRYKSAQDATREMLINHDLANHKLWPFRKHSPPQTEKAALRSEATAIMRSGESGELVDFGKALAQRYSDLDALVPRLATACESEVQLRSVLSEMGLNEADFDPVIQDMKEGRVDVNWLDGSPEVRQSRARLNRLKAEIEAGSGQDSGPRTSKEKPSGFEGEEEVDSSTKTGDAKPAPKPPKVSPKNVAKTETEVDIDSKTGKPKPKPGGGPDVKPKGGRR